MNSYPLGLAIGLSMGHGSGGGNGDVPPSFVYLVIAGLIYLCFYLFGHMWWHIERIDNMDEWKKEKIIFFVSAIGQPLAIMLYCLYKGIVG